MADDEEWSTGGDEGLDQDKYNTNNFGVVAERFKIVIIGNGASAAACCDELVKQYNNEFGRPFCKSEVCLLTTESVPPYDESCLHELFLDTDFSSKNLNLDDPEHRDTLEEFKALGIRLFLNHDVFDFNPDNNSIAIASKSIAKSESRYVFYERIIFCSGLETNLKVNALKQRGMNSELLESKQFMTLDHSDDYFAFISKVKSFGNKMNPIVVVGNTIQAVQISSSLCSSIDSGVSVTLVLEHQTRLLESMLSPKDSERLEELLMSTFSGKMFIKSGAGMHIKTVYPGELVLAFEDKHQESVKYTQGIICIDDKLKQIEFQETIFSSRNRNVTIPFASLPVHGIKVNSSLQLSGKQNVFFAGKLAALPKPFLSGKFYNISSNDDLQQLGRIAAKNAFNLKTGELEEYFGPPVHYFTFPLKASTTSISFIGDVNTLEAMFEFPSMRDKAAINFSIGTVWLNRGRKVLNGLIWDDFSENKETSIRMRSLLGKDLKENEISKEYFESVFADLLGKPDNKPSKRTSGGFGKLSKAKKSDAKDLSFYEHASREYKNL